MIDTNNVFFFFERMIDTNICEARRTNYKIPFGPTFFHFSTFLRRS